MWQDGLLLGVDDGVSQGSIGGLWQESRLQGGDHGDSQGLQGVCGKMVCSRVVMVEIVRDYRGLVARWSFKGGLWGMSLLCQGFALR